MPESDPTAPTTPSTTSTRIWPALREYFVKNPFLALWNIALIFGGLIAFTHFASIRYFPDLDVKTASSFLLGIALFGVSLITILAVVLVIPSHLLRNEVWRPYNLLTPGSAEGGGQPESEAITRKRRLSFMTSSLLHGVAAFSFYIAFASVVILHDSGGSYSLVVGGISVASFVISITALRWLGRIWRKRDLQYGPPILRGGHSRKTQHLLLASIWWLMAPGLLLLLLGSAGKLARNDIAGHVCVAGFAILIVTANGFLAIQKFDTVRAYLSVGGVAIFLLIVFLIIPSNPLSITRAVFVSLAMGDLGSSRFVVKRPTCDAVNLIAPGACEVASENAGCIRPERLANRIGSEYLLVLKIPMPKAPDGKSQVIGADTSMEIKVPIPKSEVLAWAAADNASLVWKACSAAHSQTLPADQRAKPGSRPEQSQLHD